MYVFFSCFFLFERRVMIWGGTFMQFSSIRAPVFVGHLENLSRGVCDLPVCELSISEPRLREINERPNESPDFVAGFG